MLAARTARLTPSLLKVSSARFLPRPPAPQQRGFAFLSSAASRATALGMWGRQSQPNKVQQLIDLAKDIFHGGGPPNQADLQRIKDALTGIPLEELGVYLQSDTSSPASPSNVNLDSRWSSGSSGAARSSIGSSASGSSAPSTGSGTYSSQDPHAVRYMHIFEDGGTSLGIFSFPVGSSIPLHDHPSMCVISRVLYGSLHVRAYDWVGDAPPRTLGQSGAAHLVRDQVLTAEDEPMALFPRSGGNIHQFDAVTPCAVLDILSPPYDAAKGRDCTYYRCLEPDDMLIRTQEIGSVTVLEARETPEDFSVVNVAYRGAKVRSQNWPL